MHHSKIPQIRLVNMKLPASEFKAKCLALLDQVHERGEPTTVTKHGKVVARLVPAGDTEDRPWLRLRPLARWAGNALAPAIEESDIDIEALK
jgi:prevent-host-death family protein